MEGGNDYTTMEENSRLQITKMLNVITHRERERHVHVQTHTDTCTHMYTQRLMHTHVHTHRVNKSGSRGGEKSLSAL